MPLLALLADMLRVKPAAAAEAQGFVHLQLDGVARALCQRRMRAVYSHLTSGVRTRHNAGLTLLAAVAGRNAALAWEVFRAFDFSLKELPALASPRGAKRSKRDANETSALANKTSAGGPTSNGRSTPHATVDDIALPTRHVFVGFALALLESGDASLTRPVLAQKALFGNVLRHVASDPPPLAARARALRDVVLAEGGGVPPRLRAALCGDAALEQMAAISGTDAGDRERDGDDGGRGDAARTAHDVLSRVCVDPAHGVCPASALGRWTPPKRGLWRTNASGTATTTRRKSPRAPPVPRRTAGGSPRRETSPRARSGARRWCVCSANCGPPRAVATPSCCCASASSGRTSRRCTSRTRRTRSTRDRPSRGSRRRRCSERAAAASLDPAPPRAAGGARRGGGRRVRQGGDAGVRDPRQPREGPRARLGAGQARRALLAAPRAVRHTAARGAPGRGGGGRRRRRARRRRRNLAAPRARARGAALAALPEPQALLAEISAHARLSSGRESDVNRIHALNALAEYCDLVGPEGLAEANVDPAKTLPAEPLDLPPAELAATVGFLAAARGVPSRARRRLLPDERDGADERNTTHAAASVSRASLAVAAGDAAAAATAAARRAAASGESVRALGGGAAPRGHVLAILRVAAGAPVAAIRRDAAAVAAAHVAACGAFETQARARGRRRARGSRTCQRARARADDDAACAFLAEAAAATGRRPGADADAAAAALLARYGGRGAPVAAGREVDGRARGGCRGRGHGARGRRRGRAQKRRPPGSRRRRDRRGLGVQRPHRARSGGVRQGSGERETRPSTERGGRGVRRRVCLGRAHATDGRRASRGAGAGVPAGRPEESARRREHPARRQGESGARKEKRRKEKRRRRRARRRRPRGRGRGRGRCRHR